MTIVSTRIHFHPRRRRLEQYLGATHGGFSEWFERRLKPIREQLRGPEAKGVDIVNFMLCDGSRVLGPPGQWMRSLNSFQFTFVCDLEPLRDQAPIDNIERLMRFCGAWADRAPWPQVRAATFRKMGLEGERLELALAEARRDMQATLREARYLQRPVAAAQ